jgi:2,3-bisphosphoglycerate-independent phosphoglycerate mutase
MGSNMKYAIVIPDGAADEPLKELGGKTPLEVAHTPNMDRIAMMGRQGMVQTIPTGFESGSDVATMCLLGYDPRQYHTGRAPIEAAAQRIALAATDWVFRCNLVTVVDGVMKDHSAGGISNAEAQALITELASALPLRDFEFHCGVSYRNLLVYRGMQKFELETTPPHDIPELPAAQHYPRGEGAEVLKRIMDTSRELFENHEINQVRKDNGLNPATQVWLWGQGHPPAMPTFASQYKLSKGCMFASVDLLRGLAALIGWDTREVEGMTSFHDTNYVGQGKASAAALDEYDILLSHVEAPDEASHQGDVRTKIVSIEHIDKYVVGPLLEKLQTFPKWRIMVLPDHPTNLQSRKHGSAATPFCMAGTNVNALRKATYCERNAQACDLKIRDGHLLMEYFLRSGMMG